MLRRQKVEVPDKFRDEIGADYFSYVNFYALTAEQFLIILGFINLVYFEYFLILIVLILEKSIPALVETFFNSNGAFIFMYGPFYSSEISPRSDDDSSFVSEISLMRLILTKTALSV